MTVEGLYENGKVTLIDTPAGVERARVRVTFLPETDRAGGAEGQREAALRRMLEFMRRGVDFGAEKFDRGELYEERLNRLDDRRG